VGKTLELLGKLLMQQNNDRSYTFFQLGNLLDIQQKLISQRNFLNMLIQTNTQHTNQFPELITPAEILDNNLLTGPYCTDSVQYGLTAINAELCHFCQSVPLVICVEMRARHTQH